MVSLYDSGIYLVNGTEIVPESEIGKVKKLTGKDADQASARKGTIAYSILEAHNTSGEDVYKRQLLLKNKMCAGAYSRIKPGNRRLFI